MNSDKLIKLIAGMGLFGAWLVLVILKMVPPEGFVNALQLALMALGIYHASMQQPGASAMSSAVIGMLPIDAAPQATVSMSREPTATQAATAVPVVAAQPGTPAATLQ